eukprot:scaffold87733_cov43-Prasinocladus_malaysianus.AAC.2
MSVRGVRSKRRPSMRTWTNVLGRAASDNDALREAVDTDDSGVDEAAGPAEATAPEGSKSHEMKDPVATNQQPTVNRPTRSSSGPSEARPAPNTTAPTSAKPAVAPTRKPSAPGNVPKDPIIAGSVLNSHQQEGGKHAASVPPTAKPAAATGSKPLTKPSSASLNRGLSSTKARQEAPVEPDSSSDEQLTLEQWRQRALRSEKDVAAQHRIMLNVEHRAFELEQKMKRMEAEMADLLKTATARPSQPAATAPSAAANSGPAGNKRPELGEMAERAQEALTAAGFPKLLRKFLLGVTEGNIRPDQESLWWNLVNDTSTNLLRSSSNKFEFSALTKEWLYGVFHAPSGKAAYNLLRGEGGLGSATWDVVGAQYNIPLPSIRTLFQFAKENPGVAARYNESAGGAS